MIPQAIKQKFTGRKVMLQKHILTEYIALSLDHAALQAEIRVKVNFL
jgi:hypothetical protein